LPASHFGAEKVMDLLRPNVAAMKGYVPGEQPRIPGLIKLNTNENPYPPSPRVVLALESAIKNDRLRLYPDPTASGVRKQAAALYGFEPDQVLVGNGSDEILTLAVRAFVGETSDESVGYLWPSY